MSNCVITLNVGRDSIKVSVESSQLPKDYKSLRDLLIQQNQWDNFLKKLQEYLKTNNNNPQKLSKITDTDYTIPNNTVQTLSRRFPTITFPEDTEDFKVSDKKVRFMYKYITEDGHLQYGRFIDENGEEVFIVDRSHLQQLGNYFLFCKSIISDNTLEQIDKNILDELQLIYNKVYKNDVLKEYLDSFYNKYRKTNPEDDNLLLELTPDEQKIRFDDKILKLKSLLITFVQNKNGFKNITYEKDGESYGVYSFLDKLSSQILGVSQKRKHYEDSQIESLSNSGKWDEDFETKTYQKSFILEISDSKFKQKLDTLLEEINEENEAKNKEIRKRNKGKDKEEKEKTIKLETGISLLNKPISKASSEFEQLFGKELIDSYEDKSTTGWNILISKMLSKDKGLALLYNSESDKTLVLKKYFISMESAFGVGFEELQKLPNPEYYNQYYIQEKKFKDESSEFYVTKYYTTHTQYASKFASLEDAKRYIDSADPEIVENSYKQFHINTSDDYNNMTIRLEHRVNPGNIITVLDYKVPSYDLSEIPEAMVPFLSNNRKTYKMKNFRDFVESNLLYFSTDQQNTIINYINTPEKVFLFISELNNKNFDRFDRQQVLDLAQKIGTLKKYKHYFVKRYDNKKRIAYLIPVPEKTLPEYRRDNRYPIRSVIDAANQVLAPRLGNVKMNIITNEEAQKLSGATERKLTAKAFIMNGEIYINKDLANPYDLFHEYSHILLAYLKNNKDENIRNIYYKLLEEVWELGEEDTSRQNIIDNYSDYARIDQMEEYFALKFGRWINDNAGTKYDKIFNDEVLTSQSTKLFDPNNYTKSIKELFGSNLETVLLNFNSEISYFLKQNPTLADDYKDLFTLSRRKTDWIRQQINEGKLIQKKC